jgi:hypothetical protein
MGCMKRGRKNCDIKNACASAVRWGAGGFLCRLFNVINPMFNFAIRLRQPNGWNFLNCSCSSSNCVD